MSQSIASVPNRSAYAGALHGDPEPGTEWHPTASPAHVQQIIYNNVFQGDTQITGGHAYMLSNSNGNHFQDSGLPTANNGQPYYHGAPINHVGEASALVDGPVYGAATHDANSEPSDHYYGSNNGVTSGASSATDSTAMTVQTYQIPPHASPIHPAGKAMRGLVPRAVPRNTKKDATKTRASNPGESYGADICDYPPADATPPFDVDIGLLEIFTFFPNWMQIPEVALRAQMSGWKRRHIVIAEALADDTLHNINVEKSEARIQKQISLGGMSRFSVPKWNKNIPEERQYVDNKVLSANGWHFKGFHTRGKPDRFEHVSLRSVYGRIPAANWPTGLDRLTITRCLEFARANALLDLDTSHWGWIMAVLGIDPVLRLDQNHDRTALTRFLGANPDP